LRGGNLKPLTEDHSLVAELVRSGELTRDQAAEHPQKNLITRALGAEEEVDVDTAVLPVEAGDRILLCSDGLSDMIPEGRISEILVDSLGDPEATARHLLSAALDAGGTDNVTVVVVDLKEQPEERSGDTHEMPAVDPPESTATRPSPTRRGRKGEGRPTVSRRKRKRSDRLGKFVRGLAVVLVVVVALTPAYLWGSSRYFLGVSDGEVVAYRGLPYAPLGVALNEEWRRTGVALSEVERPYRAPIENHRLYTQDEIEPVIRDLGR
jgi:hypothetical protein